MTTTNLSQSVKAVNIPQLSIHCLLRIDLVVVNQIVKKIVNDLPNGHLKKFSASPVSVPRRGLQIPELVYSLSNNNSFALTCAD